MSGFRIIRRWSFDHILVSLLCIILSVYLVYAFLINAFHSSVNIDAGYYMGVVNLIYNGLVPYRDFELGYTPLFFYVMQPIIWVVGNPSNYTSYMVFQTIVSFVNAFLLSRLMIRLIQINRLKAWFFSLLFLIFWYYLEGTFVVLENLSVLFGLCSLLFITSDRSWIKLVMAGLFSAMALLTKQYGAIFFGGVGVYLLFISPNWKERIRRESFFLLGFFVVLALFVIVFGTSGVSPKTLLNSLTGTGYGQQSFYGYKLGVVKAVRIFPFLLLLPCLLVKMRREEIPVLALGVTGLFLSSLQLYFNVFPHYYLFMLPCAFLLAAMVFEKLRREFTSKVLFYLFWGMLFTPSALFFQNIWNSTKY